MSNTQKYYELYIEFRTKMRRFQADADAQLARIERFRGTPAYDEEARKIEKTRTERAAALKAELVPKFNTVILSMRVAAAKRPMKAPTAEEINLLTVLKMRDKLTTDDIQQALNTIQTPAAIDALRDLAKKHELFYHITWPLKNLSNTQVSEAIDGMQKYALKALALPRVDNRAEWAKSPQFWPEVPTDHVELYTHDRDFSSERDCIVSLSGLNVDEFSAIINA